MNKVILQFWEESERGWGVRPDGCSIHLDSNERNSYINSIYSDRGSLVPDEYEIKLSTLLKILKYGGRGIKANKILKELTGNNNHALYDIDSQELLTEIPKNTMNIQQIVDFIATFNEEDIPIKCIFDTQIYSVTPDDDYFDPSMEKRTNNFYNRIFPQ